MSWRWIHGSSWFMFVHSNDFLLGCWNVYVGMCSFDSFYRFWWLSSKQLLPFSKRWAQTRSQKTAASFQSRVWGGFEPLDSDWFSLILKPLPLIPTWKCSSSCTWMYKLYDRSYWGPYPNLWALFHHGTPFISPQLPFDSHKTCRSESSVGMAWTCTFCIHSKKIFSARRLTRDTVLRNMGKHKVLAQEFKRLRMIFFIGWSFWHYVGNDPRMTEDPMNSVTWAIFLRDQVRDGKRSLRACHVTRISLRMAQMPGPSRLNLGPTMKVSCWILAGEIHQKKSVVDTIKNIYNKMQINQDDTHDASKVFIRRRIWGQDLPPYGGNHPDQCHDQPKWLELQPPLQRLTP